jgi:hypothetical protein
MEPVTDRTSATIAVMTIGGLITLFLAPFALVLLVASVPMPGRAGSVVDFVLAAAGLMGFGGFWWWALSRRPFLARRRLSLTVFLAVGIASAATLCAQLYGGNIVSVASVGAALIGLGVLLRVWLPNSTPHPDARATAALDQTPSARAGERGR